MTVKELIEKLEKYPPEYKILITKFDPGYGDPHSSLGDIKVIWKDKKDKTVMLESEEEE